MQIKKDELVKKLEEISEKLNGKLNEAVKDISNTIMFLSIYCGNNSSKAETLNLKFNEDRSKLTISKKEFDEIAQKFLIKSYDDTQSLEITISKSYLKIEKKSENNFNHYLVEYIFKANGNFTRYAKQKSMPMDKEIQLEEKSEGKLGKGIYYSDLAENNEKLNIVILKIPDKNKIENIYYSYSVNSDFKLFYKTPKEFNKIPCIDVFGMSEIASMLSRQSEFVRFDNENLFNDLVKTAKNYYGNN